MRFFTAATAFLITGMTFATTPTNFVETSAIFTSNEFKYSEFEVVNNVHVFNWDKVEFQNSNQEDDWDSLNVDAFATCGGVCINTDFGATDEGRDGCEWYIGREDECGNHDNSDFMASLQCCVCGGGIKPEECEEYLWDHTHDQVDQYSEEDFHTEE